MNNADENLFQELCKRALKLQKENSWILCTERMPECETEVFIQTKNGTITTAMYEDGKMDSEESVWCWNDDIDFNYCEKEGIYYIPQGWWEYKHFNNYPVDEEVMAWRPLPELCKEPVQFKNPTAEEGEQISSYLKSISKKSEKEVM